MTDLDRIKELEAKVKELEEELIKTRSNNQMVIQLISNSRDELKAKVKELEAKLEKLTDTSYESVKLGEMETLENIIKELEIERDMLNSPYINTCLEKNDEISKLKDELVNQRLGIRTTQQILVDECDGHEETKVICRQLKDQVKKLEKELGNTKTWARKEAHYSGRLYEEIVQLKATLNEIKKWNNARKKAKYYTQAELKELEANLAKHDGEGMTDKSNIVLNENDFELEFRPDDEEFNENYQKFCIIIKDNDDKSAEIIKQQILENQNIVEQLKKCIKHNHFGNCSGCYPLWYWLDDNCKSILESQA